MPRSRLWRIGARRINPNHVALGIGVVSMTGLLYLYGYASVQAAKRNAQRHREADGGQINWANEARRRHGKLDRPSAERSVAGELVDELKAQMRGEEIKNPDRGKRGQIQGRRTRPE